jgi:membrane dipeptidase
MPADRLIWDNHACMPLRTDAQFLPELHRIRQAGVSVIVLNVMFDNIMPWHEGMKVLSFMRHWVLERKESFLLIDSVADIDEAKRSNRLGIAFDIEGMKALDGNVSMVKTYRDLGVKWMLIAYNRNNEAGGGCMDDDAGLSTFGRDVIREMERVGMGLCCSHTGERTTLEAIEWSRNPVMLTHSNPRALVDHARCIRDNVMVACAAKGGTIGITGYGSFLQNGDSSAENYFKHVDYAVQLIGPEHVTLASDFVFDREELASFLANPLLGAQRSVPSMFDPAGFPDLANYMLRAGYSGSDVGSIMGGNLYRLAQQVWK